MATKKAYKRKQWRTGQLDRQCTGDEDYAWGWGIDHKSNTL